jgi:hypothetical protein
MFRLRSLVAYQILFGGRLIILDSDYINSLALRNSVIRTLHNAPDEHSSFFRTLIDERYLLIACRQENSLGEVAEQLGKRGGHDLIRPDWYASNATDIQYLESRGLASDPAVSYSVTRAAAYYTEQIQRMLGNSLEPYLDDAFRLRAAERANKHVSEHGSIA